MSGTRMFITRFELFSTLRLGGVAFHRPSARTNFSTSNGCEPCGTSVLKLVTLVGAPLTVTPWPKIAAEGVAVDGDRLDVPVVELRVELAEVDAGGVLAALLEDDEEHDGQADEEDPAEEAAAELHAATGTAVGSGPPVGLARGRSGRCSAIHKSLRCGRVDKYPCRDRSMIPAQPVIIRGLAAGFLPRYCCGGGISRRDGTRHLGRGPCCPLSTGPIARGTAAGEG